MWSSLVIAAVLVSALQAQTGAQIDPIPDFDFNKYAAQRQFVGFPRILSVLQPAASTGGQPSAATTFSNGFKYPNGQDSPVPDNLNGSLLRRLPEAAKNNAGVDQAYQALAKELSKSLPFGTPAFEKELQTRFTDYLITRYTFEVYPASTIDEMYRELRMDVLRSVKNQVLQFSIPQDQAKTLSSLLDEVKALRSKNQELEDRIKKLEGK